MNILRTTILLIPLLLFQLRLFAASPHGQVVVWGYNVLGQAAGIPPTQAWTGSVAISGSVLTNAVAIAAGMSHALALTSSDAVAGFGFDYYGQATGSASVAPDTTNGMVTIDGGLLTNVVAVAAGDYFGLALKQNGTVVAWGKNTVPIGLSNIVAIAARGYFSIALRNDGTVFGWGSEPWCQTQAPIGLSNVVAITAGGGHYERSMALKRDGTVVAWKSSMPHEVAVPPELSNVVAIAAGVVFSLALKQDGTVFGWGFNQSGEATGIPTRQTPYESSGLVTIGRQVLTNVTAIAAGDQYSLALKQDGTVVAWGNHRLYKDVPADLTNVVAIAAGDGFCLAITTNSAAAKASN